MLTGFRSSYPKIWHLGVLTMWSWRNLRYSRCRKISDLLPPFSFEIGHKTLVWEVPLPLPPRRRDAEKHPNKQVLQSFPQCITFSSYSLSYHISPLPSILLNLSLKQSSLTAAQVLIFLRKLPCHVNYYYINLNAFLLLTYQFNLQTPPGILRG